MPVARRGPERCPVLQFADDAVEPLIALQRDVLRVLIADGAELTTQIGVLNAATTQSTSGVSVRWHGRQCSIRRARSPPARFAPHEKPWPPISRKLSSSDARMWASRRSSFASPANAA